MSDPFTQTTSVGWLSRIGSSIKGVAIGGVLVLLAVIVLFWNEGRSVHRARALEEGRGAVRSASIDTVDPANEGKLIYLSGRAEAKGSLRDAQFSVEVPHALRLRRAVEMFQWNQDSKTETKQKLGGGEERVTTYSYKTVWSDALLDSSDYRVTGHANPTRKPFPTQVWNAGDATLGQFQVNDLILNELAPQAVVVPTVAAIAATQSTTAPAMQLAATSPTTSPTTSAATRSSGLQVADGMLYLADPAKPAVGDIRIAFTSVPAGPISLIAKQVGSTFASYAAKSGELLLVESGTVSADGMWTHAETANRTLTWILRAGGFAVLVIGFGMIFAPLVVVADVVPFIGSIVGAGTSVAAIIVAIPVWCITVGIAWLFYRPLLGVALLAVAIAVPVVFLRMRKGKRAMPASVAVT